MDVDDDGDDDLLAVLERIGDPRRWTFVIDFDGTLAPIVDDPSEAVAAAGALDAVEQLAQRCEVAILSGRELADLEARLGRPPTGVLLIGGHGSEARHRDGTRVALTDLDAATTVLAELEATLGSVVDEDAGWWIERKATSLVVHHRRATSDDVATTLPRVREILDAAVDREPGFVLADGKAIVELKVRGVDKGRALTWLLAEGSADRAGGRASTPPTVPVVFGDDTTDEDAFAVAVERGGDGVLVAATARTSRARFRLRDPDRVVTLLRAVGRGLGTSAALGASPEAPNR